MTVLLLLLLKSIIRHYIAEIVWKQFTALLQVFPRQRMIFSDGLSIIAKVYEKWWQGKYEELI